MTSTPTMAAKAPTREQFENWWSDKSQLFPAQLKEAFWLSFSDGWYRCFKHHKAVIELADKELVQ